MILGRNMLGVYMLMGIFRMDLLNVDQHTP